MKAEAHAGHCLFLLNYGLHLGQTRPKPPKKDKTMDLLLTDKGLQSNPDTTALASSIASDQADHIAGNTKYLQVKPTLDGDVVKEVHEYVCPDGSVGYQAFVRANVKGTERCKSFGEGLESNDRDHNWVEAVEDAI